MKVVIVKPHFPVEELMSETDIFIGGDEIIPLYQSLYLLTITSNMVPSEFSSITSDGRTYGLCKRLFTNVLNRSIEDLMIKISDKFLYVKVVTQHKVKEIELYNKKVETIYDTLNSKVICAKIPDLGIYEFFKDDVDFHLTITWL